MLRYFPQYFQWLSIDSGSSTQHVCDMQRRKPERRKSPLSATETVRILARLFDRYGIDRRLDRDRSLDGERAEQALYYAARDGLLRVPRKRGAPSKWKGILGFELVQAVELYRLATPATPHTKNKNGGAVLRPVTVAKAIRDLREQHQEKWGDYESPELQKRYHEARKIWGGFGTRLAIMADRWHEMHSEDPKNS
jgi:hypothetical protein